MREINAVGVNPVQVPAVYIGEFLGVIMLCFENDLKIEILMEHLKVN